MYIYTHICVKILNNVMGFNKRHYFIRQLSLHKTRKFAFDMQRITFWLQWCVFASWNNGFALLTYSMVQSPSWEANWFAASRQIPRISRNPKVHYRNHKLPPPVRILGQHNPVHIPTSHLLEIHPNIILPSTPRSPYWSLSLRFPHQDPIHTPLLTHTRHMPRPSFSSRFYHPHNIGWRVQII